MHQLPHLQILVPAPLNSCFALVCLLQALRATEALKPGAATALDAATLEASNAPSAQLPRSSVEGALVVDVMVAAKMLPSKAEVGGACVLSALSVDCERAKPAQCATATRAEGMCTTQVGCCLMLCYANTCCHWLIHHVDIAKAISDDRVALTIQPAAYYACKQCACGV